MIPTFDGSVIALTYEYTEEASVYGLTSIGSDGLELWRVAACQSHRSGRWRCSTSAS